MKRRLWIRYRLEQVLLAISAMALMLTIVVPNWVEAMFGVQPDGGSRSTEWRLAVGLAISALVLASLARRDHRRITAR